MARFCQFVVIALLFGVAAGSASAQYPTPATPGAAPPWAQSSPAPAAVPSTSTPAASTPARAASPPIQFRAPTEDEKEFIEAEALFLAKQYAPAYLQLLPLAHKGNAQAQYYIALMADNGVGPVQRSKEDAIGWYRKAANQNHAEAQFALSNAYALGRGVPMNPTEMFNWLGKAAENGYMPAMVAMAAVLDRGFGLPQDVAAATSWIKRAAEAGSVNATFQYAQRLQSGFGVEKNEREAMEWFTRAAMRGHPSAQLLLGSIGDGSIAAPEQNIEALVWLTLATRNGPPEIKTIAQERSRELQKNMMPSEIAEAQTRARAWKPLPQARGLKPDPEYDVPAPSGGSAQRGAAPRRGG